MSRRKVVLLGVLAALLALGGWQYGLRWWETGKRVYGEIPALFHKKEDRLDRLPDFQLPTLEGWQISSSAWQGQVVVLNFWATWCPPCVREMPRFMEIQQRYPELQVVGIAIDAPEAVKTFVQQHPLNYPILLGDLPAVELSRRLGNRLQGLPFTAVFDQKGKLIYARIGEMTAKTLEEVLTPLLGQAG